MYKCISVIVDTYNLFVTHCYTLRNSRDENSKFKKKAETITHTIIACLVEVIRVVAMELDLIIADNNGVAYSNTLYDSDRLAWSGVTPLATVHSTYVMVTFECLQ